MRRDQGTVQRTIRTIFISDVHLGSKHARADALLQFLQQHEPDALYIVGDFIDGWKLKRSWFWNDTYNRIFHRLIELANSGTRLFYTPGNHDEFLRNFLHHFGMVEVADEFVHVAADRRRYVVTHGDRFDHFETSGSRISQLASVGYELLLTVDHLVNRLLLRRGNSRIAFSAAIKQRVKKLVRFISDFEDLLLKHARQRNCHGIICGHIHAPNSIRLDEVHYFNTGDWIENCTALIEHENGHMEIVAFDSETGAIRVLPESDEKWSAEKSRADVFEAPTRPGVQPEPALAE